MPPIDATAGLIASVLVALIGVLSVKIKAKSDKETSTGPEWRSFADMLREEIGDLRAEVRDLEARLDTLKAKFHRALEYIRKLRSTHPAPDPVPDEIKEDIL